MATKSSYNGDVFTGRHMAVPPKTGATSAQETCRLFTSPEFQNRHMTTDAMLAPGKLVLTPCPALRAPTEHQTISSRSPQVASVSPCHRPASKTQTRKYDINQKEEEGGGVTQGTMSTVKNKASMIGPTRKFREICSDIVFEKASRLDNVFRTTRVGFSKGRIGNV